MPVRRNLLYLNAPNWLHEFKPFLGTPNYERILFMNDMSTIPPEVSANERSYALPKTCAIAICLDGCEPAYLDEAIAAGLMPTLNRIKTEGTVRLAHSVIPSFTNPNNLSIVENDLQMLDSHNQPLVRGFNDSRN